MKTRIENILSKYIDKNYEYDLYDEYKIVGDCLSVKKILPTDTGYYVEGTMWYDMHPEICDSEYEEGEFWATLDKNLKVLDLDWELC